MFQSRDEKKFDVLVAENRFVTDVQLVIERAMDEKGASQADLARALDVTEARVSQILSDTGRNLQARTIARIAHVLDLYPALNLLSKDAYIESRKKHTGAAQSYLLMKWVESLEHSSSEHSPAQSWELEGACNDDDIQLDLEAA